jgi:hypothetical protein
MDPGPQLGGRDVSTSLQIIVPIVAPHLDRQAVTTVLATAGVLIGAVIAFVANTSTTPTGDPQLKEGTMIRVTDEVGTVIGHSPVPGPDPAVPFAGLPRR